jgi:hypothetical protein
MEDEKKSHTIKAAVAINKAIRVRLRDSEILRRSIGPHREATKTVICNVSDILYRPVRVKHQRL